MILYQAAVLGIVQGLTEFLPVSSSAHLILFPYFLGWQPHPLVFDTSLHLGTALAIVLYFWRDWLDMIKNRKTLALVIIGVIPAGIFGVLFGDYIEEQFRSPLLIAFALVLGTAVMEISVKYLNSLKSVQKGISAKDSLFIGFMQILALAPGMSRSGMTISGGFFRRIEKDLSVKFSFYLAAPIVVGAGLFSLLKSYKLNHTLCFVDLSFLLGFMMAFIVGFASIKFLIDYMKKHGFGIFIWYRLILATLVLVVYLLR